MDGILIVNKPQRMTSHDVVDLIRKRFGFKKVGHAGTLDPMATGVLVILIGKATKLSGQLMSEGKDYSGRLTLGAVSDTLDAWGKLSPTGKDTDFTDDRIREVFKKFLGQTEQIPPMYSSVKVGGHRLYKLARKGISVEAPARKITVDNIEVLKIELPDISFRLSCSKGTYVRQICADIGELLGCGAHMSQLERTRSGAFTIDKAVAVEDLRNMSMEGLVRRVRPELGQIQFGSDPS